MQNSHNSVSGQHDCSGLSIGLGHKSCWLRMVAAVVLNIFSRSVRAGLQMEYMIFCIPCSNKGATKNSMQIQVETWNSERGSAVFSRELPPFSLLSPPLGYSKKIEPKVQWLSACDLFSVPGINPGIYKGMQRRLLLNLGWCHFLTLEQPQLIPRSLG